MSINKLTDKYDNIVVVGLISVFSLICYRLFWFTLDDAYITLRYSKHLAEGQGIVWNIGADPVEGYTSVLWMLIGAIPHSVGLPAVSFMKTLGVGATILAFVLLYAYGRYRNIDRWLLIIGSAQLSVSPAIALLSVQGMETTTAMLLVLVASIAAIELVREYSTKWAVILNTFLLLGMLARPDLVVFAILLEIGVASILYYHGHLKYIKKLVVIGFLLAFIPGIMYMTVRYLYFGHIFPNPFYIKSGASLLGPITVFEFVMLLVGPLMFLTLGVSIINKESYENIRDVSPVVFAISGFLFLHFFIKPIQGYLWRFQVPVFAAAILVLLLLLGESQIGGEDHILKRQSNIKIIVALLLISGLLVYPLFTTPMALSEANDRTQGDRVVMGQALNEYQDGNYKMFVSESGAIPYYSEWHTVDHLGLNSEHIAHKGMSEEFLEDYNPDVVQILASGRPDMIQNSRPETAAFLDNSSYRLVAVVHKQNQDRTNVQSDRFHLYFVNTQSDGYQDISCTLLTQDLEYADPSIVTTQTPINIQTGDIDRSDCE